MSHHSVESMRDTAFRKGRNGFSSDDDYLRALRGEELEDETFEDEEATEHWGDFESFLDSLLTDGSANAINSLFDWMIEYDSGHKDIGIAVTHGDTVLHLQPDVDCETPYELKFELIAKRGEENIAGGYDFTDLFDYLEQILDEGDSPFVHIFHKVDNELGMADFHGGLGDEWRERIAEYLTCKPTKAEVESGLTLKSMDGEVEDARLEFRRRPHLPDGDTTWVFDGKPSKEHKDKGCPTVLLQWLLGNHKGLL